jgi:hypothetical protein
MNEPKEMFDKDLEDRTSKKGTITTIETFKTDEGEHLVPMSLEQMEKLNTNLKQSKIVLIILGVIMLLILLFFIVIASRIELWTHIGQKIFCGV